MATRDELFPNQIKLAAQHAQRETGCPASVALAQWALESDYGAAMSGENNPFGIKGPGTACRTTEVIDGRPVRTTAEFRDFASIETAFIFHGHMLTRTDGWYYQRVAPYLKDWRNFIKAISLPNTPAYATDPNYADKLIRIVEQWKLYDLDLPGT